MSTSSTTRTTRTGVVKQWFKSRSIGELYIIRETSECILKSATRMIRTTRTGRANVSAIMCPRLSGPLQLRTSRYTEFIALGSRALRTKNIQCSIVFCTFGHSRFRTRNIHSKQRFWALLL